MLMSMFRETIEQLIETRPDPAALGSLLKAMRLDAGLTQKQLGQALGRTARWISHVEQRGGRVDLALFIQWCKTCEVDPAMAIDKLAVDSQQAAD